MAEETDISTSPPLSAAIDGSLDELYWLRSVATSQHREVAMSSSTRTHWFSGIVVTAALCLAVALSAAKPAQARVFVGFGFGFPIGFPGFYYPPYPYPYYPPPAYYPPPSYPPPASYQPSSGYAPPGGYAASGSARTPTITYTQRPGWTNAQGQYCREYRMGQGAGSRATEKYGTACRDAGGQWRIVN
jgi:hypothetical protein